MRTALALASLALVSLVIGGTARDRDGDRSIPGPSPTLAASPVAAMIGTWEGTALVRMGAGEAVRVHQTERVEWRMHQNAVVVEGLGEVEDVGPDAEGFAALGVITANERDKTITIDAFRLGSGHATSELTVVSPTSFSWTLDPAPGVTVRYTVTIDGDTWTEIGEASMDGGKTWHESISMTLERTGP